MNPLTSVSQALRLRRQSDFHGNLFPAQFVRDKFIFIHIPKCAGSSFLNSYIGFQLGHATANDYCSRDPLFFREAFSCAFVRDPVHRFISAYNHVNTCELWPYLPEVARQIRLRSDSLSDLAENIHLFPELLALEWFAPQNKFITIDGKVAVTRVFRSESFNDSIKWISDNIGISFHSACSSVNIRGDKGLKYGCQDISSKGISNLRRVYWRDFTLFGYF